MAKKRIPLHPGAFIKGVYIDEGGVSAACIAEGLGINTRGLSVAFCAVTATSRQPWP